MQILKNFLTTACSVAFKLASFRTVKTTKVKYSMVLTVFIVFDLNLNVAVCQKRHQNLKIKMSI